MKNINHLNPQLMTTFDLSTFSQTNVTFLSEQVQNKKLFKIGYYHFFKIPQLELDVLKDFLQILDFNKAYIVLPILTTPGTTGSDAILSLSKQILVTRDSNPIIISNFLMNQIEMACSNYGIENLENFLVVFKFRPLSLREEIVQEIPKIQYEIKEKYIKRNINMLNSKFFNGSILPLSMNLKLYKNKLNKFSSRKILLTIQINKKFIWYIF
jgi:hypothetical protein